MVSLTVTLKQEEKTMATLHYPDGRVRIVKGLKWLDRNAASIERMGLTKYPNKKAGLDVWTKDAHHKSTWQDGGAAEQYIQQKKFAHVEKTVCTKSRWH
jgi:hypothetical protein